MQLHELQPTHKTKKKKRIGRGGKRGVYSGRGVKGQKARAGRKIRPAERDLFLKFPKLRGRKNKSRVSKPLVLSVGDLEKKLDAGIVNTDILMKSGIIKRRSESVKILGNGEVKKKFTVEGIAVSGSAAEKIVKAGGTVN